MIRAKIRAPCYKQNYKQIRHSARESAGALRLALEWRSRNFEITITNRCVEYALRMHSESDIYVTKIVNMQHAF